MPLPPVPLHALRSARFSRRDFLLGSGVLAALAVTVGLRRLPDEAVSSLDDFMLVSQTVSGAPLDRHAGLACFSALHRADIRFVDHVQTLAWLVRRHPGLTGTGLIGLLEAEHHLELRAALGRLVDVWSAHTGTTPALADARARIDRLAGGDLPSG